MKNEMWSTEVANLKAAARRGIGLYLRWKDIILRVLFYAVIAVMYGLYNARVALHEEYNGVIPLWLYYLYIQVLQVVYYYKSGYLV
jgi:hypothetical protein